MAETDVGGDMTLKKKMTRMEFRKRADDILVRLTMEVEPFWQDSDDKQTQRIKRAAADPLYFCRTYLPHYFSHLPAPFHYELVKLLEARPAQVTGRTPVPPTEDAGATLGVAPAVVVPAVVAAPREFAKTTVCAFGYVLHQICFKRRNFIIIGSDTEDLASDLTGYLYLEMLYNERLHQDFGELVKANRAVDDFVTANDIRVKARGRGQRLRGLKHKQWRPDLVILDDLENDLNVRNPEIVKQILDWVKSAVYPSLDAGGSLLIIGTILRWHSALHLLLTSSEEPYCHFERRIYRAVQEDGTSLWEARHPTERLMIQKRFMGSVAFNREKMNEPTPDSGFFQEEWIHYYHPDSLKDRDLVVVGFFDPSLETGAGADYKAVVTVGWDPKELVFYVMDAFIQKATLEQTLRAIFNRHQAFSYPSSPPSNGAFYITDLKFDAHLTFAGAARLRTLEFKMEQQGTPVHEWWLDDVSLNLEAQDTYPYTPRLAISLTPYGQNPWRGPTPVHYAQPLAPYLAGAASLAQTYVALHRDAQNGYTAAYGGTKGPILPVHTRNDIENIALMGCEDFGRFSWWPRYRNFGLVSGVWHYNGALTDASGHGHTWGWSGGAPTYTTGVCQPGQTAIAFEGSAHASLASNSLFEPGLNPFSLTLILKGLPQATGYCWLVDKMGADGWVIQTKTAGSPDLQLKVTTAAGEAYADIPGVLDGSWHLVTWMVSPADAKIYKIKDQALLGNDNLAAGHGLLNTAYLNIGSGGAFTLDYFKYERRLLPADEYQHAWNIVQGNLNGSAYPEVGCGLGQYWAFYRLAQYFFASNDATAGEVLGNWLTWLNENGAADT